MSRPIKFRAWVTDLAGDSFMLFHVTPYYLLDSDWKTADKLYGYESGSKVATKVKTDTAKFELMQFTGLLDKNGKEIYEGDIVRVGSENHLVTFGEINFGPGWYLSDEPEGYSSWLADWGGESTEVIGNVHENPDLLK